MLISSYFVSLFNKQTNKKREIPCTALYECCENNDDDVTKSDTESDRKLIPFS